MDLAGVYLLLGNYKSNVSGSILTRDRRDLRLVVSEGGATHGVTVHLHLSLVEDWQRSKDLPSLGSSEAGRT